MIVKRGLLKTCLNHRSKKASWVPPQYPVIKLNIRTPLVSINTFNPESDQHLYVISPYNITAESFIKIMKIKEMITNLGGFVY